MLTEQERDAMAHAIGHHSAKGCSTSGGRNYYCAASDDPMWLSLVERGFATRRTSSLVGEGQAIFHVTDDGIAAVEADPRSQPRGKLFAVRFKCTVGEGESERPLVMHIGAESRGKAKYEAARDLADAWNMTVGDAFRQITSCRLEAAKR
jgi:acyl-CoA-binding protein